MPDNTRSRSAFETEPPTGSHLPDALSVPYPYSRTLDGEGASFLSVGVGNGAEIDRFCEQKGIARDSYIRTALLCALLRIVRQDGLALSVGPSNTVLPGSLQWLELPAVDAIESAHRQFRNCSQSAYHMDEVHFILTAGVPASICEETLDGDLIRFCSEKDDDGGYVLSLTYNAGFYSGRDMQALLDAWNMLVTEFCRQDCPVKMLPIVTPEERDRLLAMGDGDIRNPYNPGGCRFLPENVTIVENFMRIARECPEKVVVIDTDGSFTCGQLNSYGNRVARWLIAQGISQGSVIGILTPRCREYLALAVGVLKAGCTIVTLEEDYPQERRDKIIEEARIHTVLTLDMFTGILDSDADDSDICLCTADSVFQIFFTSGTTGIPKGVVRLMAELTHDLNNAVRYGLLTEDTASINIVRFSFVACIADIWLAVAYGSPVHIIPYRMLTEQPLLADYIRRNGVTYALMPSGYGVDFVNNYESPLRNLLLSAEKIRPVTNRKVAVTNLYASTEVLWATSKVIRPGDTGLTAGVPQPGTQLYILDRNHSLLPRGTVGEICISSTTLARDYLNNPQLSTQRFISNPFIHGKRMFCSGDLGYLDENGELNIVGRIDNMVKLRGFRIELDEISHTAAKCPEVDMCTCTIIGKGGGEALCCYYTSPDGVCDDLLKAYLSKRLPPYMVPDIYMHLDRMPLNASGKIDRMALPEPEHRVGNIVLPATADERLVLDIAEKLMGVSPIGVTSDLISLGLTSIAAMRLATSVSVRTGRSITMSRLMSSPTVRGIVAGMSDTAGSHLGQVREKQEYYPLADNQIGIYLDWERYREGLQYNMPFVFRLKGYDSRRLRSAVESVVAAHPYLKARLAVVNGDVVLQRRDEDEIGCTIQTLDIQPDTADPTELLRDFFQRQVRPFDLFEGPLCRFGIYTCGEYVCLFLDIHHIISDGLSAARLVEEFLAAYNGETIAPETFTAFDRALEEREIKQSESYSQAESYFRKLLAGLESTSYPHSLSGLGEGRVGCVSRTLRKRAVEEHCARLGVTAGNYLLTVFMEVIKRVSREEKVLITTVSNGREHAAMQDIQGFFVKTLPVVSADTPAEVQSQLMESIGHECYHLTEMVQRSGIRPEIMYAFEGGLFERDSAALYDGIETLPLKLDTAKVPLALTVSTDGGDFELEIEYDDSVYNESDMQALLHCVVTLALNYAESEDSSALKECSMLTKDEERRLIALGTGEILDYDSSKTFIDLFREQVDKTPDAVAIVDEWSQLTYRELDKASSEYAKTVTSGTFVCLEMPGVKEFVVAVLGIWKAGSAYVPIDAGYPEQRKLLMRQECDGKPLPQPDVAYMIYTSGSTGKPKGVMVQHSALLNCVRFISGKWNLSAGSRISCHASFAFDASVEDLYPVLTVGGCLYIVPQKVRMDTCLMYDYIVRNRISGGCYSTGFGQLLLQQYPNLPVDYLVVGGEKMTAVPECRCRLINTYGPTECTVDAAFFELAEGGSYDNIPIGRPVDNLLCFILDLSGHLHHQGVVGELCIAGPQLALGYYGNPELTAEKFVNVTIGGKSIRIFRTGDLCRWNADGQLEYIGRIDNQVKLRGFRIEPGEIESAALRIETVRQAVAMVRNGRIVLYFTSSSADDLNPAIPGGFYDRLNGALSSSLPEYMIPNSYVKLESMPLTPGGKIDRKALPEPASVRENYIAPESRIEKLLCGMIENLLHIERLGIDDTLRGCGMSSIQAMKLKVLLHNYGLDLNLGSILKADNVRNLCRTIEEGVDDSDVGSWLGEFDSAKPSIVLCCGVMGEESITGCLSGFCEKYNIYLLQPVFNAWSDIDDLSHEEIVSRYLEIMKQDIHGRISCIMGFSYGGELAYHLAVRWNALAGNLPLVFMGDTVITRFDFGAQPIEYGDDIEALYYELQNVFFSKRKPLPVPDYEGGVILVSAENEAPYRLANEQEWKSRNPHIVIVPVRDTHRGLFRNAEHFEEYLSLIERNVSVE